MTTDPADAKFRVKASVLPADVEDLGRALMDAAFKVHRTLGPGLLESVYEACLCLELSKAGVPFQHQVNLPIEYEGVKLSANLRIDLLLDSRVVVELKSVDALTPLHEAQLLTYLKLTGCRLGYLLNFNTVRLKDGLVRRVL